MAHGDGARGADELVRSLRAAAQELDELDASAGEQTGELLEGAVRDTAPRDTGHMAQTVTHTGPKVTVGAPYAVYVHARNPWAARALEQHEEQVQRTYETAIDEIIQRVKGA